MFETVINEVKTYISKQADASVNKQANSFFLDKYKDVKEIEKIFNDRSKESTEWVNAWKQVPVSTVSDDKQIMLRTAIHTQVSMQRDLTTQFFCCGYKPRNYIEQSKHSTIKLKYAKKLLNYLVTTVNKYLSGK